MIGRSIAGGILLLACLAAGEWQEPARKLNEQMTPEQAQARAAELIERARAAIGGEEAIRRIATLTTTGRSSRPVKYVSVQGPRKVVEKEKTLNGKLSLEFAFPEQFRLNVKGENLRGFGFSYSEIVNGPDAWRDPPLPAISSNRDSRVIDVEDFRRTELMSAQGARQRVTFFITSWLLRTIPSFPIDWTYIGRVTDGAGAMETLVGQGRGGFSFFLLIDPQSHRPAGVAITFVESIQRSVLVESSGYFDRRFMQETFARARQERQARARPPARHQMILRFSDYRQIDGVWLPHRITTKVDEDLFEEIAFDEIRLNREIDAKKFKGPPKAKK
ncbi:MAG: hypothetical protein SF339_08380 [Blastocatellia bacterium]|nr:hypothetical protein [Blastocatellia bacterium]